MGETTGISWCDATLNFWIGCTKVSPACDHCYAETWGNRFGVKWGPGEARRRTVKWLSKAKKLQRAALAKKADGHGQFLCFSNSLADIFDKEVPIAWLAGAVEAMRAAPDVTFLLLTKRPGIIVKRARAAAELSLGPYAADDEGLRSWWPRNVALLCTVVTQPEADSEIPKLQAAKEVLRPAFVGISMEPLVEAVDLSRWMGSDGGTIGGPGGQIDYMEPESPALDWVITGGESGAHARPSHPDWFRSIRDQCAAAGVPYHHKQNGEWAACLSNDGEWPMDTPGHVRLGPGGGLTPDGWPMQKVGTKHSGRLLDGVTHDAMPVAR